MKVTLRQEELKSGKISLFLDYYPAIVKDGKTTRKEMLRLYLHKEPRTRQEKRENEEVLARANGIRNDRFITLTRGEALDTKPVDFIDYYRQEAEGKYLAYSHSFWHFVDFCEFEGVKRVPKITKDIAEGFKDYLLHEAMKKTTKTFKENIAHNTAWLYWQFFRSVAKGFKADMSNFPVVSKKDTAREFFFLEELRALYAAPCPNETVKRAGLFSALTGLRYSDIRKLQWSNVRKNGNRTVIVFEQKKTSFSEAMPIGEDAAELLLPNGDDLCFPGLTRNWLLKYLPKWFKAAGIERYATFHAFRHTFATLQLTLGTDIYTLSKMLGHRDLKTTQVYSRLIDQKKEEAADRIRLFPSP